MSTTTGNTNLITDVAGLKLGNAQDKAARTGVTVLLADQPVTAAVDVRGAAAGTSETDLLGLAATIQQVHAIVLSGGSVFGLSASTAVRKWLLQRGMGFRLGPPEAPAIVPLVPQAILFDLLNGGDRDLVTGTLFGALAETACEAARAAGRHFELGTVGAGYGATTANLKGGLGSASTRLGEFTVGALAAVNPVGQVTIGDGPHFWAAPFEQDGEFGGLGLPANFDECALRPAMKGVDPAAPLTQNTTLAIIATDATLTKPQCHRLAVMAQTGMARAIYPVHAPFDGDTIFALSTGVRPFSDDPAALSQLGAIGANTLARAIARGVYEATSLPSPHSARNPPSWRERFG